MLPSLREELSLFPGPMAGDGSPTWTLLDPVRNRFFRIGWPVFEILGRWELGGPEAIVHAIRDETPLHIAAKDVDDVVRFLARNFLLRSSDPEGTSYLNAVATNSRRSWAHRLLHNYLFFRIPLVKPDRFLSGTVDYVSWVFGGRFLALTALALALGLFLVTRQWDRFVATLVDTFTFHGAVLYGLALAVVKVLHELGHAYAAKRYGCRVATMGVAFLVMWPVLYTDTNEAWKLTARRQRLVIGLSGVLAELSIAAFATLAWVFSPEGTARELLFVIATVTWVSSLLINLSPFMRFDGYFVLMDWFDMPNLHARAFALARWWVREVLFGLGEPPPEWFSRRGKVALIAFALATWTYRLFLFLGIAVLVYEFAFKALGVILFAVEIGWFIVLPVWREVGEWRKRWAAILTSPRTALTVLVLAGFVGALVYPWNDRVFAPAMLKASRHTVIFTSGAGLMLEANAAEGNAVGEGDVLFVLDSPELRQRLAQVALRIRALEYKLSSTAFDSGFLEQSAVVRKELETALSEKRGVERELAQLVLRAPFSGTLVDVRPDIGRGQWIGTNEPLVGIRDTSVMIADAYLPEEDITRIAVGDAGLFYAETPDRKAIKGRVVAVDGSAIRILPDKPLGISFGGTIKVRENDGVLIPERALYRVRLAIDGHSSIERSQLRGTVLLHGRTESLVSRLWNSVMAVLVREMDF